MRKKFFLLLLSILIITITAACVCGCGSDKTNVNFYERRFDSVQGEFVRSGVGIKLHDNYESYEMFFPSGVTVFGEAVKNYSGYSLNCKSDIVLTLNSMGGSDTSEEYQQIREEIEEFLVASQQIFFHGDYIFDASSIQLIKQVSADSGNLASPEGVYEVSEDDKLMYRFASGLVYSITIDDKGVSTEESTASGRYVVQDGFLTLFRINSDGSDLVLEGKKQYLTYLFASISYPENFEDFIYTEDEYSETVKSSAAAFAGKTVAVLCSSYYQK